jgi:hypothetical protein
MHLGVTPQSSARHSTDAAAEHAMSEAAKGNTRLSIHGSTFGGPGPAKKGTKK